jgi:phospholipid/cholesterol/gamma-HCH transport system permease protein
MIREIGKYFIFLGRLLNNRETFITYYKLTLEECIHIGIGSILLVAMVSTFIGAVTTVQTAYDMVSALIPNYVISQVVREMTVLELAPHYGNHLCGQGWDGYGGRSGHHAHH